MARLRMADDCGEIVQRHEYFTLRETMQPLTAVTRDKDHNAIRALGIQGGTHDLTQGQLISMMRGAADESRQHL